MSPDDAGFWTMMALLAIGAGVLVWQVRECGSLSVWTLTRFFRLYCMLMLSQRVHGPCPVPVEGGALLVSNHRSPVDPILLYSASLLKEQGYRTRVPEFLTASEYCQTGGLINWVMRTCHVIPVARNGRDMASAKEALRRLQAGRLVAVFPEGGIHRGTGLGEFNTGVAWLALRGNATVIPAVVRNTPYQDPIFSSFLVRQHADAEFGPPVDLSRWAGEKPSPEVLREVTEYLRSVLLGMLDTPPARL